MASQSFVGTPFVAVTRFASANQPTDLTVATMRKSTDGGSTWLEAWTPDLTSRDAGSPTFSGFTTVPEALASNARGTTVVALANTIVGGGPPTWNIAPVDPLAGFNTGARSTVALGNVADFRFARLRVLDVAPDAGAPVIALLERRTGGLGGQLHRVPLSSTGQTQILTGSISFAADDVVELPGANALAVGFRCHMTCGIGTTFSNVPDQRPWTAFVPADPRLNTLGSPTLNPTFGSVSGTSPHRLVGTQTAIMLAGQRPTNATQLVVQKLSLTGADQGVTTSSGPLRVVDAINGPDPDTVLILAASTGPGTFGTQTIPHGANGLTDVVVINFSVSSNAYRVQTWSLPGHQVPVAMAWTNVSGIIESYRLIIVGNEGNDGFMWAVPL